MKVSSLVLFTRIASAVLQSLGDNANEYLQDGSFPLATAILSTSMWARVTHQQLSTRARARAFTTGWRLALLTTRFRMPIVFRFGCGRRRRFLAGTIGVWRRKTLPSAPGMFCMIPNRVIGVAVYLLRVVGTSMFLSESRVTYHDGPWQGRDSIRTSEIFHGEHALGGLLCAHQQRSRPSGGEYYRRSRYGKQHYRACLGTPIVLLHCWT